MRTIDVVLLAIALILHQAALSQPYHYSSHNENGIFIVNRLNLRNSIEEEFFRKTTWKDWYVRSDRTQRWLFLVDDYGPIVVVDTENPTNMREIPLMEDVRGYRDITYIPPLNRFYVTWNNDYSEGLKHNVFDASTLSLIDSLTMEFSGIYSADGSVIYRWSEDTTANESYIDGYSTSTHTLVSRKNEYFIGPPLSGGDKSTFGAAKKYILYGYQYPQGDTLNDKYQVYNLAADTTYPAIPFPARSRGHLSANGKLVIIEEVRLNPDDSVRAEFKPGSIYIYESETGRFVSHLNLPTNGEILIFPNHPDTLYYYLADEQRSVNVALPQPPPPSR